MIDLNVKDVNGKEISLVVTGKVKRIFIHPTTDTIEVFMGDLDSEKQYDVEEVFKVIYGDSCL